MNKTDFGMCLREALLAVISPMCILDTAERSSATATDAALTHMILHYPLQQPSAVLNELHSVLL